LAGSSCDVTVVVPTRDRWELLSTAALPSALGQRGVDHEVIVVDDGSSDGTPARLAAMEEPRLRVLTHERSQGVAQARNAGIRAAKGEWVAFLDDDDLWSPDKLRLQIEAADAEGSGFTYGGAAWVDQDRRFVGRLTPPDPTNLAAQLLRWNVIWAGCSNVVARRSLVSDLGGFDEQLFQLADWDLWIRLALASRATACPEIVVGYVMQPRSMLLTDRRNVLTEFSYLVEKHRDASRAHGVELDRARFSRWAALGYLRGGRRAEAVRTYLRGSLENRDPGALARAAGAMIGPKAIRPGRALLRSVRRRHAHELLPGDEPPWLQLYR
jgi:glycosyltransferase involved in cell wall biosynthesis